MENERNSNIGQAASTLEQINADVTLGVPSVQQGKCLVPSLSRQLKKVTKCILVFSLLKYLQV